MLYYFCLLRQTMSERFSLLEENNPLCFLSLRKNYLWQMFNFFLSIVIYTIKDFDPVLKWHRSKNVLHFCKTNSTMVNPTHPFYKSWKLPLNSQLLNLSLFSFRPILLEASLLLYCLHPSFYSLSLFLVHL